MALVASMIAAVNLIAIKYKPAVPK